KQQPEAMPKCLGFESPHVAGLPLVKRPARLPEHQFVLVFGCHEPTCGLSPGRPGAQLPPPATAGRPPPPRSAPGVLAELLSAAERSFSKGCRNDPIVRVGAQFSQAIGESIPSRPVNLLDADRGCDATAWLTRLAMALETLKTLDRAGAPRLKAQS